MRAFAEMNHFHNILSDNFQCKLFIFVCFSVCFLFFFSSFCPFLLNRRHSVRNLYHFLCSNDRFRYFYASFPLCIFFYYCSNINTFYRVYARVVIVSRSRTFSEWIGMCALYTLHILSRFLCFFFCVQ